MKPFAVVAAVLGLAASSVWAVDGIVLNDVIPAPSPFGAPASKAPSLHTGDAIRIEKVESRRDPTGKADVEFLQVATGSGDAWTTAGWVPSNSVFSFDQSAAFAAFVGGTFPARHVLAQTGSMNRDSEAKISALDSEAFHRQALRNPNPEVRTWAASRIFFYLGGEGTDEKAEIAKARTLLKDLWKDASEATRSAALRAYMTRRNNFPSLASDEDANKELGEVLKTASANDFDFVAMTSRLNGVPGRDALAISAVRHGSAQALRLLSDSDAQVAEALLSQALEQPDSSYFEAALGATVSRPGPWATCRLMKLYASSTTDQKHRLLFLLSERTQNVDTSAELRSFVDKALDDPAIDSATRLQVIAQQINNGGQDPQNDERSAALVRKYWGPLSHDEQFQLLQTITYANAPKTRQALWALLFNEADRDSFENLLGRLKEALGKMRPYTGQAGESLRQALPLIQDTARRAEASALANELTNQGGTSRR